MNNWHILVIIMLIAYHVINEVDAVLVFCSWTWKVHKQDASWSSSLIQVTLIWTVPQPLKNKQIEHKVYSYACMDYLLSCFGPFNFTSSVVEGSKISSVIFQFQFYFTPNLPASVNTTHCTLINHSESTGNRFVLPLLPSGLLSFCHRCSVEVWSFVPFYIIHL